MNSLVNSQAVLLLRKSTQLPFISGTRRTIAVTWNNQIPKYLNSNSGKFPGLLLGLIDWCNCRKVHIPAQDSCFIITDLILEDTLDNTVKKSTESSTATKSDSIEEKSIWSGPAKLPDEKSR